MTEDAKSKPFYDPEKCWGERGFRNFVEVGRMGDIHDACNSFDIYVGEMTIPSFKKKALISKYYRLAPPNREDSNLIYDFCPLQKLYAGVEILKLKMTNREKRILSEVDIIKRSSIAVERIKKKNSKGEFIPIGIPPNFSDWVDVFKYIQRGKNGDTRGQIEKKKQDLRICLDGRIQFMKWLYDCGETRQSWIKPHLEIIIKLQILASKHGA